VTQLADLVHESLAGMFEEVRVPAVWTVAHRGYSGNRRLDVWIYRDENTALRAAAELAMSCGVDEDSVAVQEAPLNQFALARVVKNMADSDAPPMTIRAAVDGLEGRTPLEIEALGSATTQWRHAKTRRRRNTALLAGLTLITGVGIGIAATYSLTQRPSQTTVVRTLTVSGPPAQLIPIVSTNRDPVCDQWQTAARGYRNRLDAWTRTAPISLRPNGTQVHGPTISDNVRCHR
jgi:hypothetical protein